jgi:cytochrome o ubiquinol oxidase operon protein cyoD
MTDKDLHHAEHAAAHGDVSHGQSSHGSRNSYIVGFILSAILTVIPFWLIMSQTMTGFSAVWVIAGFAAAQVAVQVYFFLHVDFSPEQRNTLYSFLFTLFVVAIVMVGSLWIMHNANENMMPGMNMGGDSDKNMPMKMPMNPDGTPRLDRELEGFEEQLNLPPMDKPMDQSMDHSSMNHDSMNEESMDHAAMSGEPATAAADNAAVAGSQ